MAKAADAISNHSSEYLKQFIDKIERLEEEKYKGDFQGTPILLSGSAHDMHVPAQRIHDSAQLLQKMSAEVSLSLFEDDLHTIRHEELTWVNQQLFL